MKKIYYLLFFLFLFVGCKSNKQITKSGNTTLASGQAAGIDILKRATHDFSTSQRAGKVEISEDINEMLTYTRWSTPDSTGRQYKVATAQLSRTGTKNTGAQSAVATDEWKQDLQVQQKKDTSTFTLNTNTQVNEREETTKQTPSGLNIAFVVLAAGVVVVVILILKRFKLIK